MSKQSEENYLDELLNSVSRKEKQNELVKANEDFVRELKGAISADTAEKFDENGGQQKSEPFNDVKMTPKAEAEFLMEFEQELAGDDFDDFLKDFEENNIRPEDRLESSDMEITEEDALLSMLGGDLGGNLKETREEEPDSEEKEAITLEELALNGIQAEEIGMDESDLRTDSDSESKDEVDLSKMGDEDLISLLAGAEDLSDIGELLSQNDNDVPVEEKDSFALFAESEMSGQSEEDKQKPKESKKVKFWDKIANLLFGKEEEEKEEPVTLTVETAPSAEMLSDENAQILAAFAEAEKAEAAERVESRSGARKEKKKKEPKAKKPAKQKAPKKPKPKKPKEKDNTPPLPKGPVALVCLLAVSIFLFVFVGAELISYSSAMSQAEDLYKMGHYAEAAEKITGLEIRDEDTVFYGQIVTLAAVDSQISEYEVFLKNDRKAEALDSLISAAGRVEVNSDNALVFGCTEEMDALKQRITAELQNQFELSYDEVIELYQLTETDRDAYTIELNKLMTTLGIITE